MANLQELVMKMSNRSYFESLRYIKSKEQESDITQIVAKQLYTPPTFVQYDEVIIKRLNSQALESPRAMRYFDGRLVTKSSVSKTLPILEFNLLCFLNEQITIICLLQ